MMRFGAGLDFSAGAKKSKRQVNLTPLIDMMFLLVIFFMLTTSFGITNLLQVKLAAAAPIVLKKLVITPAEKPIPQKITIKIETPNNIFVDGDPVDRNRLDSIIAARLQANPDMQITLEAGDGVSVQILVEIIDRINISGGENIILSETGS